MATNPSAVAVIDNNNILISDENENGSLADRVDSRGFALAGDGNVNSLIAGDSLDSRGFLYGLGQSARIPRGVMSTPFDAIDYNMNHKKRGKCLIFNQKVFDPSSRLNERRGTDEDAKYLKTAFGSLDFEVHVFDDLGAKQVLTKLKEVAQEDHSQEDCFACCVLTHGERDLLWARDDQYIIESLYFHFKGDNCPSLAGKPKIFVIQACQGDKLDGGVEMIDATDSGGGFRIPSMADFLIAFSTFPGYYSWRNTTKGSWFIQSLAEHLCKYSSQMDLVTLLTLVNRTVAYQYESNVPNDPVFDHKKQIPCITSMLTRRIFFPPKTATSNRSAQTAQISQ